MPPAGAWPWAARRPWLRRVLRRHMPAARPLPAGPPCCARRSGLRSPRHRTAPGGSPSAAVAAAPTDFGARVTALRSRWLLGRATPPPPMLSILLSGLLCRLLDPACCRGLSHRQGSRSQGLLAPVWKLTAAAVAAAAAASDAAAAKKAGCLQASLRQTQGQADAAAAAACRPPRQGEAATAAGCHASRSRALGQATTA